MTALRSFLSAAAVSASLLSPVAAQQGLLPQPQNVVSLTAQASVELAMDWLTIAMTTTKEGPDAAGVQAQLKQALDAALAEARKAAKPGEVNVRTGAFSLYPRYGQKGALTGWQGSAELIVEGRDTDTIAKLTGRIGTLAIGRVMWSLSREAREKVEADVSAQAITRFRSRADAVAKQFGFANWTIREVNVAADSPPPPMPRPMMRAQAMAASADESLPVEAGRATVTATVSGSVQLAK